MPTTVNGIGTHYYGKNNLQTRQGECGQCNREADLSSYDTRLFFVLVFIPLIPLGKKRVIDECSRCRRHQVMDLADYEEATTEVLTEMTRTESADPTDAEAAVSKNAALWEFHKEEEARTHLDDLSAKFPDNVDVQLYAGSVFERLGETERADRCFSRAYGIDPNHPRVRHAKAIEEMDKGRPDQAVSFLSGLAPEERDAGLLFAAAEALQQQGNSTQALEVFRSLQRDYPGIDHDKTFRKAVKLAEKGTSAPGTLLPKVTPPWVKKLAVVSAVVVVVIGALSAYVWWAKNHCDVWVTNAWPEPITLVFDDIQEITVEGSGLTQISLPEGDHVARVSGQFEEEFRFETRAGFWQRFDDDTVRVVNPGGLTVLIWEHTEYSSSPSASDSFEDSWRLFSTDRYIEHGNIDYSFKGFPESINVKSNSGRIRKTRFGRLEGGPFELVQSFLLLGDYAGAGRYLASWFAVAPSGELALDLAGISVSAGTSASIESVLRRDLPFDPIDVDWHRAYQEVGQRDDPRAAALLAEYDGFLAASPSDPDLLYLRGRIEPDPTRAMTYYSRATAVDRGHSFARRAMGYQNLALAQFGVACTNLEQGLSVEPENPYLIDLYHEALNASGRHRILEPILRADIEGEVGDISWSAARTLLLLMLDQGRVDEANELMAMIAGANDSKMLMDWLQAYRLYVEARYEELTVLLAKESLPPGPRKNMEFWVALETGDAARADAIIRDTTERSERGYHTLLLGMHFAQTSDDAKASALFTRALTDLTPTDPVYRIFAQLMDGSLPPEDRYLRQLILQPDIRATLLTALAQRHKEHRGRLLKMAAPLIWEPKFPSHFLKNISTP